MSCKHLTRQCRNNLLKKKKRALYGELIQAYVSFHSTLFSHKCVVLLAHKEHIGNWVCFWGRGWISACFGGYAKRSHSTLEEQLAPHLGGEDVINLKFIHLRQHVPESKRNGPCKSVCGRHGSRCLFNRQGDVSCSLTGRDRFLCFPF